MRRSGTVFIQAGDDIVEPLQQADIKTKIAFLHALPEWAAFPVFVGNQATLSEVSFEDRRYLLAELPIQHRLVGIEIPTLVPAVQIARPD